MRVAIYGRLLDQADAHYIQSLFDELAARQIDVVIFKRFGYHMEGKVDIRQDLAYFTKYDDINGKVDSASLTALLRSIKTDYPAEERLSLLVEDSVAYEQIIRVMDSVRMYTSATDGSVDVELFPAISMGDIAGPSHSNSKVGGK